MMRRMCQVCYVKDDGVAKDAQMVPGQRINEVSIALPDKAQLSLLRTESENNTVKRWKSKRGCNVLKR